MGRRAAGLIVALALTVGVGALLADVAGSWRFHDLWCFYHGGEAVLRGVDPYDAPTWLALTDDPSRIDGSRVVKAPCPGAFGYPYWSALAFAPLAAVPYDVAAGIWGALLIAGIVAGVALAGRATGAPLPLLFVLMLGSPPLIEVITFGQLTGVLLPLVGLAFLPPAGRAGVSLGLLALKPQLVGIFGAALVVRAIRSRDVRFPAGAIGSVGVLLFVSLIVLPTWPLEWAREIATNRLEIARPMPTAWGLSVLLFGDAIWGVAQVAVLVALLVVVARGRDVKAVAFGAIALAVSLFAAPYAGGYDHLFLVIPWAVVLAAAARSEPRRRRVLLGAVLAVAVLVPWTLLAAREGSDTVNALVPALTALLVTIVQPRRVRGPGARTPAPARSPG